MARLPRFVVRAPVTGCVVPLDRVPDPVFSRRMVGDGIAIDPLDGRLVAPCDGRIVQIHASGHALTLATVDGVEIMMHIGLDTVQLRGQGFRPRVAAGATVRTGDTLVEFDADFISLHARSLLTQVVITAGARVLTASQRGIVQAGEDVILELSLSGTADREADGPAGVVPNGSAWTAVVRSDPVRVLNPAGLHARPAAVLAGRARQFAADIRVERGDVQANAKSVVSLMGLEIAQGDLIRVNAAGRDAEEAVRALTPLIESGLGDAGSAGGDRSAPRPEAGVSAVGVSVSSPVPCSQPERSTTATMETGELVGIAASAGVVVGSVVQVRPAPVTVPEFADDPNQERRALEEALDRAKAELQALQERVQAALDPGRAAIFGAHRELLDDPALLDVARAGIGSGKSAALAWREAYTTQVARVARLRNERLAARAADLREVGERVLRLLTGAEVAPHPYAPDSILVATDLTPSDTARLDPATVLGFCTVGGGATSHVAILARSLGIPAVAGIDPRALDLADGTLVVLDGTRGTLRPQPSRTEIARIQAWRTAEVARRRRDLVDAPAPAVTRDGHRVEVAATVGSLADAEQAVALGAESIGLLRSEFLFVGRDRAPSEEEQTAAYTAIVRVLAPDRPVVIRLLDLGGDKPLAYLPIPREDNPFLGERGVRALLSRPSVMRPQIRAILRASREGPVRAMVPMLATLEEWRAVSAVFDREAADLGLARPPLGMMVEVPSAALLAGIFAREVDFFSIGSNDLAQYVLAMDRGHPKLAPQIDGLHPAVLRLVAATVRAGHEHRRRVGLCGGLAGDAQAIAVLIGLGVDGLSVSAPAVPSVKARIRALARAECEVMAARALDAATAADVRALFPLASW
jgi:phosphocarrier protein FPr